MIKSNQGNRIVSNRDNSQNLIIDEAQLQTLSVKPILSLSISDDNASESNNNGTYRISLDNALSSDLKVNLFIAGKADHDIDYNLKIGDTIISISDNINMGFSYATISIPKGQTSIDITLDVINDSQKELAEDVFISLTLNDEYELDPNNNRGSIFINDNDLATPLISQLDITGRTISGEFANQDGIVKYEIWAGTTADMNSGNPTFKEYWTGTGSHTDQNNWVDGSKIYLQIRSVDADGVVSEWVKNSFTWHADNTVFDQDIVIPTTPENFVLTNKSVGSVFVNWDDSTDSASGISHYLVQLDDNVDFTSPLLDTTTTSSEINISNLSNGSKYYYRVKAVDNQGNEGLWNRRESFKMDYSSTTSNDFNGDGKSDILLKHKATGLTGIWENADTAKWKTVGIVGADWEIADTADFNGDSKSDILLKNKTTGLTGMWESADTTKWKTVGIVGADWEIVNSADFNGDSKSDILLKNKTTGLTGMWENADTSKWKTVGIVGADWDIAETADFNGDSKSDILLKNKTTGLTGMWESADTTKWKTVGIIGADWSTIA